MLSSKTNDSVPFVSDDDFKNEWVMLHNNIEKYENFSLIIKLVSVLASIFSIAFIATGWVVVAIIFILWLQDGIWKTFQKRLEERIVLIEKNLSIDFSREDCVAFQLYSQWAGKRLGSVSLVKEYLLNSVKPTVAYPYVFLIVLVLVYYQLTG